MSDSADDPFPGAADPTDDVVAPFGRATRLVSGLTLLSRISGFARVVIVTAVLGRTALGDVYQSVNLVPNLVFELVAAGTLQAALLPALVGATARGGTRRADEVANIVLGWIVLGMAAIALVVVVLSPVLVRLLFLATSSETLRAEKIDLGVPFLLVFAPQLVCYGAGLVAAAVLQARHRFGPPAIAPLANNLVVIGCYLWFDHLRGGAPPSLDLTGGQVAVLAGGTTLGVIVFTAVPVVAAGRLGVRWRPRLRRGDADVQGLWRAGLWAGVTVAATQALTLAVLLLGNGAEGAVPTFFFAFAIFQLPYALVAVPVATTRAPLVAREWVDGDTAAAADLVRNGLTPTVSVLAVAGAAMVALAWPTVRLLAFGETAGGDLGSLAHAVAAFGPGLVAYGALHYLTRIAFAIGVARWSAVAAGATAVTGAVAMAVACVVAPDDERAAVLAACFSLAPAVGAVLLARVIAARFGRPVVAIGVVGGALAAAALAGVAMGLVEGAFSTTSRAGSALVLLVAGAAGALVAGALFPLVTRRSWRVLLGAPA